MPVIEISGLHVSFGPVVAVDDLTLSADAGEVLGLIGPNGAGKTTTVEALEGFRRPDGGQVRVAGLDPVRDHDRVMKLMGVMLQGCRLYSAIRPIEAVRLFASYHDPTGTGTEQAEGLLDRVGLAHRSGTAWRKLSGGEQQRLALALALVGRPKVVLLDEPTAGLDVEGRLLVRAIIEELRTAGACVLITSHELDELARVADRLAIIGHGRLLAQGSLTELAALGVDRQEIRFRSPGADSGDLAAKLTAALAAPVRVLPGGVLAVGLPPDATNVARLTAWLAQHQLPLQDLQLGGPSLEEIYLQLTATPQDLARAEAAPAHETDGAAG